MNTSLFEVSIYLEPLKLIRNDVSTVVEQVNRKYIVKINQHVASFVLFR